MKTITAFDVLTRSQYTDWTNEVESVAPSFLRDKKVLIIGSSGSIGEMLGEFLATHMIQMKGVDIREGTYTTDYIDITDKEKVRALFESFRPHIVFHLAANKHAPICEANPRVAIEANIIGTQNVIECAKAYHVEKFIFTSTCKAIHPETVYGASKLICERYVLLEGYSVARLFNVVETQGNVFRLWEKSSGSYTMMPCYRYFISLREALGLVLFCAYNEPGCYMVDPGESLFIPDVCQRIYGTDACSLVQPRIGDRIREPLHGIHEKIESIKGPLMQIKLL